MYLSITLGANRETLRLFLLVFLPLFLLVWAVAMGRILLKPLRRHELLGVLLLKWLCTVIAIGFLVKVVMPMVGRGGYEAIMSGLPLALFTLLALTALWRHSIAEMIARPFENLYVGGGEPEKPHPVYSVAQARQKQGKYAEAIEEIRNQLARFPSDVQGYVMMAEVQARDLKDLPAAQATIDDFCAQEGQSPPHLVFALYSMADWHLELGRDRAAARRCLERVIEVLPDTEFALNAAQRIAHLGTAEMYLPPEEQRKFEVIEGPRNLGLTGDPPAVKVPGDDPAQAAADYVKHLEEFPLDTEAREKLAILYAEHYGRLDIASDELEQMIAMPNQPARLVVHWLNLLADLQVHHGADLETVRGTLQRIIDAYPKMAAAEMARKRLNLLKLEFKGGETKTTFKLGVYEQNIGLKKATPDGRYPRPGGNPRANA